MPIESSLLSLRPEAGANSIEVTQGADHHASA